MAERSRPPRKEPRPAAGGGGAGRRGEARKSGPNPALRPERGPAKARAASTGRERTAAGRERPATSRKGPTTGREPSATRREGPSTGRARAAGAPRKEGQSGKLARVSPGRAGRVRRVSPTLIEPAPVERPSPVDELNALSADFMKAKILLAGAELGVFDHLDGGAPAESVAAAIGGDLRGTQILLDALCAIEILRKRDGRYANRPEFEPFLRSDWGSHFRWMLRHRNRVFRNWALLEDRITGRDPVTDESRALLSDPVANENFIRAMYAGGARMAPAVVDAIDLDGVRIAADLGGGPGHYLAEMARRAPQLEPWLVDLPLTLETARRIQGGSDVQARLRYLAWDFYRDPAPPGLPPFDLIFVSAVLHAEGPDENRALLAKLAPLVPAGGRLIVQENVVDPDRTRPQDAALFAVNMLAGTPRGRTYTVEEIRGWGEAAGFSFVSERAAGPRHHLIEMRKGPGPASG